MAVFDYRNLDTTQSKALFSDALALTMYSYHNLDNGFAVGYQQNGLGLGLPATLVKAVIGGTDAQGVIPGIPWNPDSEQAALATVQQAGWNPISATQLGYQGKVDGRGTFFGESAGYTTAQAEVLGKYDASGKLVSIGIAFRGTSGPRESLIGDSIGDAINDLLAALGPADYAKQYSNNAFGTLLADVAAFAQANGLTGKDVTVSGHSLGGLAVNSMADLSGQNWGGFYHDASYVAFASPTQAADASQVLNIGFENDPVFRALDGSQVTWDSLGVHDKPQASATDNIVNFNDHYASDAWNLLPFSIGNLATWVSHLPSGYDNGLNRVLDSAFYDLTGKDSTLIVANLSDPARATTWVEDLNRNAESHSGSTFIIGSESADLIKGGRGNDFLEGRNGNDTFGDGGGFNLVLGGQGHDTLALDTALNKVQVARDAAGTLYVRDASGGISIAGQVEAISSKEPSLLFFSKEVTHQVTDQGLLAGNTLSGYAHSLSGDAGNNTLNARTAGDWLFGLDGNDRLNGSTGNDVFVGGKGEDTLVSGGGKDTFVFNGEFGNDRVLGYQADDKLVFMGVEGAAQAPDYLQHATTVGSDTVLSFGDNSVTLIGVSLENLAAAQIIIA